MVFVFAALVLCALCFFAVRGGNGFRFESRPAHAVISKWYAQNGRRHMIPDEKITNALTLSANPEYDCTDKYIIIKSENLKIFAYTEGKILYDSKGRDSEYRGERITLIPVGDVCKNGTIQLMLTPIKNKTGKVKAPVYIADNNDYLFTLLSRESTAIKALLSLLMIEAGIAVMLMYNKSSAPLFLAFLICMCAVILIFARSDLSQFLIASSRAKEYIIYSSYAFLSVLSCLLAASIIRAKRKKPPLLKRLTDVVLRYFNAI
ncbi:MAG: hypothetical protein IKF64_04505 [Eubacterium sp.]|nr:hypothetical protein [Eubacterium sp.]